MGGELKSQKGFTLVELVLVIVLLGVMAAAIVPRFFNLTDFEERAYFDEVVAACRYAQKLAVVSGCDVRLVLSSAGFALGKRQACDDRSAFTRVIRLPGKDVDIVPPPGGVAVSAFTVIFSPFGSAMNSSRVVSDFSLNVGSRNFMIVGETGYVDTP